MNGKKNNPIKFFVFTIASILLIEFVILTVLGRWTNATKFWEDLISELFLAAAVSPVLYFFFLRPLAKEINERKEAVERLHESGKELNEAQRLGRIGNWNWDIATDTISWFEEYYRIFGLDPAQRPPKYEEHLKAYTPESAARLDAAVKINTQSGKPYELDLEIANPKGSARWITARSETKRDIQGKIIGLRGTAQDITERKRAETEREQFFKFFQLSTDIMVIADPLGCFKKVNPTALRILGYSESELLSKPFIDFVHPDDQQPTKDEMARQMKVGASLDFKNRYMCKGGTVLWLSWRANYDKKDGITYATARDITKERQAAEINEKLATVVRYTDDGVISMDIKGIVTSWNKGAEIISGYDEKEAIGKNISELTVPQGKTEDLEVSKNTIARVSKGERIENYERQIMKKNGNVVDVNMTVSPITEESGKITGISVIARDITKAKEIERAKNDFLVLASHQMRTPLSGTRWMIETLKRGIFGKLEGKQKEYIDEIYKTNNRMIDLVSGMMSMLTLESGAAFKAKEKIAISKFSDDIISVAGALAESKKIILKDKLKGRDDAYIYSDFQAVKNILECFVSNAINYSSSGKEIEFGEKEESGEAIFFVKDHGIGIPEEEKKHIFERFFRGYRAKAVKPGGTGLGLSLALLIADKIGAKISFESQEGKGSTFYLRLPKENV